MHYLDDAIRHPLREVINYRLRVLETYQKYGELGIKTAFGLVGSTAWRWQKCLEKSGGRLSSLAPLSRAPNRRRVRLVNPQIELFVVQYRTKHPGIGKETITPILSAYCLALGLKPISESTVGRIITDLKKAGKLPKGVKLTINGLTGRLKEKKYVPPKKLRRGSFRPQQPGDLVQVDAMTFFVDGLKRYVIAAIDLKTRFAFAWCYATLSSANAQDFMQRFELIAPFAIRRVQTDNGKEFQS